jgi:hypothetical protein
MSRAHKLVASASPPGRAAGTFRRAVRLPRVRHSLGQRSVLPAVYATRRRSPPRAPALAEQTTASALSERHGGACLLLFLSRCRWVVPAERGTTNAERPKGEGMTQGRSQGDWLGWTPSRTNASVAWTWARLTNSRSRAVMTPGTPLTLGPYVVSRPVIRDGSRWTGQR